MKNIQLAVASAVAAAVLNTTAHAQSPIASSGGELVKNIVLVHGAFADGSGWRGVYDELTRTKPSWAVIATEDKAFDQAMLVHMAERIGANITKVSASHAVFMTQPKIVATTIDRAAKATGSKIKQK